MKGNFHNLNMSHYRFARTCEGFRAESKSSGWAWWLAGAACGALILLAVVPL